MTKQNILNMPNKNFSIDKEVMCCYYLLMTNHYSSNIYHGP